MHPMISLAQEIDRRRKYLEDREVFIDVMERDGFDMKAEIAALERERELLARDLVELRQMEVGRPA